MPNWARATITVKPRTTLWAKLTSGALQQLRHVQLGSSQTFLDGLPHQTGQQPARGHDQKNHQEFDKISGALFGQPARGRGPGLAGQMPW